MKASNQIIGINGSEVNKLLGLLGAKTKKEKAKLLMMSITSYYRMTTSQKQKMVSDNVELNLVVLLNDKFNLLKYEPRKLTEDIIGKMYGLKYRDRPKLHNQKDPEIYESIRERYKGLLAKRSLADPISKTDLKELKELFNLKLPELIQIYKSNEIKQYIYNKDAKYKEMARVGSIRLWLSLFIHYEKVDLDDLKLKIKKLLD